MAAKIQRVLCSWINVNVLFIDSEERTGKIKDKLLLSLSFQVMISPFSSTSFGQKISQLFSHQAGTQLWNKTDSFEFENVFKWMHSPGDWRWNNRFMDGLALASHLRQKNSLSWHIPVASYERIVSWGVKSNSILRYWFFTITTYLEIRSEFDENEAR